MTLHIVSKAPDLNAALADCLRVAAAGDSILLIEDGVLAAVASSAWHAQLAAREGTIYALDDDVAARGLQSLLGASVTTVDYGAFVDLCCQHPSVQSWF